MTYNIIPIDQAAAQLPALMRQRMASGQAINKNFSDGVRDAFPVLSIRGKVFRARISGQEQPLVDPNTRMAYSYLDVVLVNAAKALAKSYYIKGYSPDNEAAPPDCWSLDSIRPDPSVAMKVSPVCGTCPMNAFGSAPSRDGVPRAGKACQDARRVAVVMPHQLGDPSAMVLLLRVAQTSLKNLKAYAQLLERHGIEPGGCVTRLSFDNAEAYPKLLFNFVAPLNDMQYTEAVGLAESDFVASMLMTPDFDNAITTPSKQDDGSQHAGLGGLVPQAAPVFESQQVVVSSFNVPAAAPGMIELPDGRMFNPVTGEFVEKPAPAPEPKLHAVQSTVIELPDGKLYDTATGQYVERAQPAVQMPEPDPATLLLPDGKFFNTVTKQFVTGPEKGAKEVALEQPTMRTRARRTRVKLDEPEEAPPATKKAAPATEKETPATNNEASTPAPAQAAELQPNSEVKPTVKPSVSAAPMALQEMLSKLLPTS